MLLLMMSVMVAVVVVLMVSALLLCTSALLVGLVLVVVAAAARALACRTGDNRWQCMVRDSSTDRERAQDTGKCYEEGSGIGML